MNSYKFFFLFAIIFLTNKKLFAQDVDLFQLQDEQNKKELKEKIDITTATFKTTRMINGQSIENVGAGILDFKISHRFGNINTGSYNFFGLDQASMRIGLDYGITSKLMVGVGRSTYNKDIDAFLKYKILRQSTGKVNMPVSVSYAATGIWKGLKAPETSYPQFATDKFSYAHQLILARKFNDYFSFQLMPTLVHYNMVPLATDPNDLYSIGTGFRARLSKRVNLTGEYYYQINQFDGYHNALSLGFDIETGGHVFQLHFTNSTGINEKNFITQTTGQWGKGDIRFGFNISRVFTVAKNKTKY